VRAPTLGPPQYLPARQLLLLLLVLLVFLLLRAIRRVLPAEVIMKATQAQGRRGGEEGEA
jgi:hypothetical protein